MSESFNILPANIVKRDDISLAAKGLYWLLKSYQNNKTKVAFPSLSTLETQSGQSRPTIIKILKELKLAGIIQYNEGKNKGIKTIYSFKETSESSKESLLPNDKSSEKSLLPKGESSKKSLPKVVKNLYPNYINITNNNTYNEIEKKLKTGIKLNIAEKLIQHIKLELPEVSKLKKQLTLQESEKLINEYDKDIIKQTLAAMENYNKLKNYSSVYLTLKNWIDRTDRQRNNKKPETETESLRFKGI